ncbi:MAG: hypothetical protein HQK50_08105 [Oligoflexia bacterium]|nr:hypothetical protein [Oligoflexia bacterium]MBF0365520.1 hypothetical protein [Oligoflexia bacterium]
MNKNTPFSFGFKFTLISAIFFTASTFAKTSFDEFTPSTLDQGHNSHPITKVLPNREEVLTP